MKKAFVSALIFILAMAASATEMSAQRPGRSDRNRTENTNRGQRPGRGGNNGSNSGNNRPDRPGNNGGNHNNSNNRPEFNRPGHNNNNNHRPEGNRPGLNQPGHNNNNNNHRPEGNRPGFNRPGNNFRPAPGRPAPGRPGYGPIRPGVQRPATWHRPYRPGYAPARPFFRPAPPRSWRAPAVRVNLWSNILGVTIGMTINSAIDRLLYDGYTVTGYNANEIYLTNVPVYNYDWPDATMYYDNGALMGSRFYYSTYGYDMMRYRQVYNRLTSLYGMPVSSADTGEGVSATWYGSGNQFITLDFGPMLTDGGRRYFTTLSIGM